MAKMKENIGFGFNPLESKHHFLVIIPKIITGDVAIWERFEWDNPEHDDKLISGEPVLVDSYEQKIDQRFDRLKCNLSRPKWKLIESAIRTEFNQRLKEYGQKTANWKQGQNAVQRLFGKELTLLCWAIEDCDIRVIPTAIKNWQGLKPEERWWLYTMTNASSGEANAKFGWRTAIRYALTENPVTSDYQHPNIFDQYLNDVGNKYHEKDKESI